MQTIIEEIVDIDDRTGKPVIDIRDTGATAYVYESGFKLEGIDLGVYDGVKLSLSHPQEGMFAIVLTAEATEDLGKWLLRSMAQKVPSLPSGLYKMLQNIAQTKGFDIKLKRGDKKIVKDTLKILGWFCENSSL